MARNTRNFSDLDLNFTAHPVTGDISRRFDENAIKTSLKNLILTNNFERPFHSEIGTPIRGMLFEPFSPMLATNIERAVFDAVSSFEPRVNLDNVEVVASPDENSITITLTYRVLNTLRPITLDISLERTR
jgi:phage baseplate assembly protein W